MDTIFAVSSGMPPAAIAVLRISGPRARDAAGALAGPLPEPRRASVRSLHDPSDGALLDRALLLRFDGPRTATGEDLVELHLHGGRAVVRAVEQALTRMPGLRPAEAGEFTRRAMLNGRIDLSEAEGLADLLLAETEAQRRVAVRSAEGGVRRQVEAWSGALLALSARIEALLDHSDEDDVDAAGDPLPAIRRGAAALAEAITAVTAQPPVERLRDGVRVVLAGPPNAGKSTLFNVLAGREAAIVSPIAGTTRDRIEAPVVRSGIAYLLVDTAGLNAATDDAVEAIGVARAQAAIEEADVLLWLCDDPPPEPPAVLWVHGRCDAQGRGGSGCWELAVSAKTGHGVEVLWEAIGARAAALLPSSDLLLLNRRQHGLAAEAAVALRSAAEVCDPLLLAEHLRSARRSFDQITGRAGVEAMLDALFGTFCIGK
jgi:tRNA modification GTPase